MRPTHASRGNLAAASGWDLRAAFLAFVGGALGGRGLIAFYRAMAHNLIGGVASITGVVAAALPTVVGLVGGERLRPWQLGGIVLGLCAIVMISGVHSEAWSKVRAGITLELWPAFGSVSSSCSSTSRARLA